MGWRLATGQGYVSDDGVPTAYWPVGYPAFLAVVYLCFGHSWLAAGVANAILGAVIVILTYWLARQVVLSRPAMLAAMVIALLPSYIVAYTSNLRNETFYTVFVLLVLIATCYSVRHPNWRTAALLGVVIGLSIYIRPVLLLFPCVFGILLIVRGLSVPKAIVLSGLAIFVALATISPWTVRNYIVMGEPVLTATNGGITFYVGNGPGATGKYRRIDRSIFSDSSEMTVYREGIQGGLKNIVNDPGTWLSILPTKFLTLWKSDISSIAPYVMPDRYHEYILRPSRWIAQLYYVILVLSAFIALLMMPKLHYWMRFPPLLILLTLAYWTGFHLMFHGQGRFHMPMVPVIVIMSVHLMYVTPIGRKGFSLLAGYSDVIDRR